MIQIEPFEIHSIVNGTVWLDGGAMFGVVPKVMWQSVVQVDEQNRIMLRTRTLIVVDRTDHRVILVDTGCGTKWAPDKADRYGVSYDPEAIPTKLASIGLTADDVTDVIIAHLHFDHNGGLTRWRDEPDGPVELVYPQATHWIHRQHWDHAHKPHPKDRASFIQDDFAALEASGKLSFLEGDEPAGGGDGVSWFVSHGHTPYQMLPIFGSGDRKLMFVGDAIPTAAHLPVTWVMAYDVQPMMTIQEKQWILSRCMDDNWLIAFPHEPEMGIAAVDGPPKRPVVREKHELA